MKHINMDKVLSVLNSILNDNDVTLDQLNVDLSEFGMDSIVFIQIIVSLEEEFECEIPDSKLLISEMNTVNKIYQALVSIEEGENCAIQNNTE